MTCANFEFFPTSNDTYFKTIKLLCYCSWKYLKGIKRWFVGIYRDLIKGCWEILDLLQTVFKSRKIEQKGTTKWWTLQKRFPWLFSFCFLIMSQYALFNLSKINSMKSIEWLFHMLSTQTLEGLRYIWKHSSI